MTLKPIVIVMNTMESTKLDLKLQGLKNSEKIKNQQPNFHYLLILKKVNNKILTKK